MRSANYSKDSFDDTTSFLYSSNRPFWYQGLVDDGMNYDKVKSVELDKVLSHYNSKKIVIGHTFVPNICTDFGGRVIRLDVPHGRNKNSGKTKGLLIENGCEYVIDDLGNKTVLK